MKMTKNSEMMINHSAMVIHCNWPFYSDFVSVSIHFCLYVIGTTLLQLSISIFFYAGTYLSVHASIYVLLVSHQHCISAPWSLSLCLYVTATTLVLLFICIGIVGTVGRPWYTGTSHSDSVPIC